MFEVRYRLVGGKRLLVSRHRKFERAIGKFKLLKAKPNFRSVRFVNTKRM